MEAMPGPSECCQRVEHSATQSPLRTQLCEIVMVLLQSSIEVAMQHVGGVPLTLSQPASCPNFNLLQLSGAVHAYCADHNCSLYSCLTARSVPKHCLSAQVSESSIHHSLPSGAVWCVVFSHKLSCICMTLTYPFCMQLAHPKGRHWSATQPLRSTAHQMIAGKNKPVNSLPSQISAKRQRELTALQLTLQSAPAVLQDMASHAAEAVAVCYLAEARSGLNGEHPSIAIIA